MGKRKAFWALPWTKSRLLSRKLAIATFVLVVAIGADLAGHPLTASTLSMVQNVVLAYLAVQGIVDFRAEKLQTQWMTGQATAMPDSVDPAGGDC